MNTERLRGCGVGLRREHYAEVLAERPLAAWFEVIAENFMSEMTEWGLLAAVAEAADCHILLDVNNVYVNARNHGFDPADYLAGVPKGREPQFHLAGHEDHGHVVIDTHDHPVCDAVWDLYRQALLRFGDVPTLEPCAA